MLWYANVGFTANIACGGGGPGLATFWAPYADQIIKHRVNTITGRNVPLIRSTNNM